MQFAFDGGVSPNTAYRKYLYSFTTVFSNNTKWSITFTCRITISSHRIILLSNTRGKKLYSKFFFSYYALTFGFFSLVGSFSWRGTLNPSGSLCL